MLAGSYLLPPGPLLLFPTGSGHMCHAGWPCDDPSSSYIIYQLLGNSSQWGKKMCLRVAEGGMGKQAVGDTGASMTAASCCPGQVPTLCHTKASLFSSFTQ